MRKNRHAVVYGSPGARIRIVGLLRTQWPLLAVFGIAGYLIRAAIPIPQMEESMVGTLFLVLAAILAIAANYSRIRIQSFLKGAKGEELVARELGFLSDEYTVFHDITIRLPRTAGGSANLDHIVVGPNGVFAIETKNWSDSVTISNGELLYAGQKPTRPPLEQVKTAANALREFLRLETNLDLSIRPVLCFASDSLATGEQGSVGVLICDTEHLLNTILTEQEYNIPLQQQQAVAKALIEIGED
jgi:hypothetical protein